MDFALRAWQRLMSPIPSSRDETFLAERALGWARGQRERTLRPLIRDSHATRWQAGAESQTPELLDFCYLGQLGD